MMNYELYGFANVDVDEHLCIYNQKENMTMDVIHDNTSVSNSVSFLYRNIIYGKIKSLAQHYSNIILLLDYEMFQYLHTTNDLATIVSKVKQVYGYERMYIKVMTVEYLESSKSYVISNILYNDNNYKSSIYSSSDKTHTDFNTTYHDNKKDFFKACYQTITAHTVDETLEHCVVVMGYGLVYELFSGMHYREFVKATVNKTVNNSKNDFVLDFPSDHLCHTIHKDEDVNIVQYSFYIENCYEEEFESEDIIED